jgi:hypothetical protein
MLFVLFLVYAVLCLWYSALFVYVYFVFCVVVMFLCLLLFMQLFVLLLLFMLIQSNVLKKWFYQATFQIYFVAYFSRKANEKITSITPMYIIMNAIINIRIILYTIIK